MGGSLYRAGACPGAAGPRHPPDRAECVSAQRRLTSVTGTGMSLRWEAFAPVSPAGDVGIGEE